MSKRSLLNLVSKSFQRKDQLSIDEDRFPIPQASPISFDTYNLSHPLRPNVKLERFLSSIIADMAHSMYYYQNQDASLGFTLYGFVGKGRTI